jgi:hypothetical protein
VSCRACAAYKGLEDASARAASDEYYSSVFRLPLNDRINPHAFCFAIAKMVQERTEPRLKQLNESLRALMHQGEGPFPRALANARRSLQVDLGSSLIVSRTTSIPLTLLRSNKCQCSFCELNDS